MAKLISFTVLDGDSIFINPDHVVSITRNSGGSSNITLSTGTTHIVYSVVSEVTRLIEDKSEVTRLIEDK